MNRLFVFDVDGTLVDRDLIFKKSTIDSLNKLIDQGDIVAIASGRCYSGVLKYISQLKNGRKFLICANGSKIYEFENKLLKGYSLKIKDFIKIVKLCEKHKDFYPYFYKDCSLGYFEYNSFIKSEKLSNDMNEMRISIDNIDYNMDIEKVMIQSKNRCEVTSFNPPLWCFLRYSFAKASNCYIEFTHRRASKGNGVNFVRKYLKIRKQDVYVFGDSGNDISMFKKFKNSIAMDNGFETLKKRAKYITKKVSEDGVSFALKEILNII